MSINVTIKGNPINTNTGSIMATSGASDAASNEIKKRRQMRLQQVRQQSKDIAQSIRDKVKNEHQKQISQASHDNATKLKQWQNQKLLQLQTQYKEGLDQIGSGHIQAAEVQNREEDALVEHEKRKKEAKARGFQASQKLQIAKNERNMKKAVPMQQKKLAREVENTRASMVSKIKNKFPEKADENRRDFEMGNDAPVADGALDIDLPDDILNELTDETPTSDTEFMSIDDSVAITTIKSHRKQNSKAAKKNLPMKSQMTQSSISSVKEAATIEFREQESPVKEPFHLDTRISDRIKSRLLPFPESKNFICGSSYALDYASIESFCCPCPNRKIIESTGGSDKQDRPYKLDIRIPQDESTSKSTILKSITSDKKSIKSRPKSSQSIKERITKKSLCPSRLVSEKVKEFEVPIKPPIALIPNSETLSHMHSLPPQPTNISRVQYYDHRNRYNAEYLTDNANIQKIADENLVKLDGPHASIITDRELMIKRDREAQIRGQKAFEKQRIHKEYDELLQKLPVLLKQERIACVGRDKPTFHMNQDRLKETEIKRQNVMENAYENLFIKVPPTTPTLKIIPDSNNMPFVTIHNPVSSSMRSEGGVNVKSKTAEGETAKEPLTGPKEISQNNRKLNENQTSLLQILLQNLQQQKEMLQQLGSLPEGQILDNLIDIPNDANKTSKKSIHKTPPDCSCKPVKTLILQNISTQTSPAQTSRTSTNIVTSSPKRPHRSISNEADESTSPKRAKKIRSKVQSDKMDVNTNLTRAPIKSQSVPTNLTKNKTTIISSENTDSSIPVKISKPSKVKHKWACKPQLECDQLCEIRIRIQENEKPEIIICSPKKSRYVQTDSASSKPTLTSPSHSVAASKPILKALSKAERKRTKMTDKTTPKHAAVKKYPVTWGEHFTRHSSSSSTTYYSPPTMQVSDTTKAKRPKVSIKSKSTTESSGGSKKQIDQRLMTYITKLLDLSKAQIDELNVSSVSEVTTPGSSIIESSSNRPMKQLMNVMKLFKLSPSDIATNLNYSKDTSPAVTVNSNSTSGTTEDYDASKSLQTEPTIGKVEYRDTSESSKYYSDSSKNTNESGGFITKYAEMADICTQRISDLTAEIEQIRREKQQILDSHSESDKENSTQYSNLPKQFGESTNQAISPHSIDAQEQLNKELLRIQSTNESGPVTADVDYEEFFRGVDDVDQDIMDRYIKLKTDVDKLIVEIPEESSHILSEDVEHSEVITEEGNIEGSRGDQVELSKIMQNANQPEDFQVERNIDSESVILNVKHADRDILDELSNNKSEVNKLIVDVSGASDENIEDVGTGSGVLHNLYFVPLLDDIPRLPKLGTANLSETQPTNQGKRPPPSKGLIAARKFKGDIIAAPHELSTIAEADSLISAKLNLKQTPDATLVDDNKTSEKPKSNSSSNTSEENMSDMLAELIGKVNFTDDIKEDMTKRSDTDTSTEKSDLETIENMLRSIGMDWAIATLRKTRETLGRNSSSSSSADLSGKQLDCKNSSVEICGAQIDCKNNDAISISECEDSTIESKTADQYSFRNCCACREYRCKEFDNISQISGGTDKSIGKCECNRTSTPVQTRKKRGKTKSKDVIFTGESDLSSVPENMDDQYLAIPDVSLKSHNRTE